MDPIITFNKARKALDLAQGVVDGVIDTGVLQTNINQKLADLEVQYAPRLTSAESQLADVVKPKTVEQVIEKMINKQPVTILCYGDSITYGYVPNSGAQTANPYPAYLQTLLQDYYGYTSISVQNYGYSSRQSDELASDSYISSLISKNPDMVILMVGINDCNGTSYGPIVPVEDYKNNIGIIVSKLDCPFIFMTPTFYQGTENQKSRFPQYVQAMREMARTLNTKLVDLHSIVLKDLEVREVAFSDVSPDNTHYTDDYYKKIAEFVFSFGLCNMDITISKETFIPPTSSLWKWKNGVSNFYTSAINPMKKNILLRNDQTNFDELSIYLFVNDKDLALQSLLVANGGSSQYNTVEINGVSYAHPSITSSHAIWYLKEAAIPLTYGLNKIKYKTSALNASKLQFLLYGLSIIRINQKTSKSEVKYSGNVDIKSSTEGTQKTTKLLTLKDNNFTKMTIKFTPSAINSGLAFGTGKVIKDGAILEYPLATVYDNTLARLYLLKMNTESALYNTNGNLNYELLFSGASGFNMNAENTLVVTVNANDYNFELNGVSLFTLPKTTFNLGVLDVWGYSTTINSCVVKEISVLS